MVQNLPVNELLPEGVHDNFKLRIQMQITAEDGRTIGFDQPVTMVGLRDFFDRLGRGVAAVFVVPAPLVIICTDSGPNKISSIKKVREITNLGLREAKDFVEGASKLVFSTPDEAAVAITTLETTCNCKLEGVNYDTIPLDIKTAPR